MRFTSGVMTGIMLGAAAGVMASPMMSKRAKKRIARTSKRMVSSAERTIFDIVDLMR